MVHDNSGFSAVNASGGGVGATSTSLQASGHSGKYLGLGNKSGLGGTHRHSLEKLKEYESQLLLSSTAANNTSSTNSNMVIQSTNIGGGGAPQLPS